MTTYRRAWWAKSKWTLVPLYTPMLALRIACLVCRSTRELTRSAYKGTKRQVRRVKRRKVNKRAATHDVASRNPLPKVTERNQLNTSFFRLPPELRQLVYDECFIPGTVRIVESSENGFKLSCSRATHRYGRIKQLPPLYNHVLDLSLVCRQIYCETIHYIYAGKTFDLSSDLALGMPSLKLFPRKHLNSLRSIQLNFCFDFLADRMKTSKMNLYPYCEKAINPQLAHVPGRNRERRKWLALWKLLADLPLLERLLVDFMWLPGPQHVTQDEYTWILAPLLRFRRPKPLLEFEVASYSVPEPVSPGWSKAIPYQLTPLNRT